MTAPLPTSNPQLAELHERYAGDYLRHFDHAQTSYRAREVIIRRFPDGEPRRDEVAGELRMSERTLQRRLEEEGTSFLQLWTTRAASSPSSISAGFICRSAQAAYLLGFADQSSFFPRRRRAWFDSIARAIPQPAGPAAAQGSGAR